MKKLSTLIITASIIFACNPKKEQVNVKMNYTLDWRTDHLHVSLAYTPTEADGTTLHYGEISYGGQADIFSCVKNFQGENCIIRAETMDLSASPLPSGCKLIFEADGTPQVEITDSEAFAKHFVL